MISIMLTTNIIRQGLLLLSLLVITLLSTACCHPLERRKIGKRRYSINFPTQRPPEGYRLLVFLHGQGGSEHQAHRLLGEYGSSRGYIVVGPASKGKTWSSGGDDVDFVNELVREMQSQYGIPRDRTLLLGHSAGALACYFYGLPNPQNQIALCAVNGFCPLQFLPMLKRKEKIELLLLTGEKDRNRPSVEQGARYLRSDGYLVHSAIVKDAGHGYDKDKYNKLIIDWFEERMASKNAKK